MKAWVVAEPGPVSSRPLRREEREPPEPGPGEVRVAVAACGGCRTDLHVAEGDLPTHRRRVVPGHEVIGRVDAVGPGCERFAIGDRVGIAGIHLSQIPPLDYHAHLFQEREVRSVTANTRADGQAFLELAAQIPVRVTTTPYPLDAADEALTALAADRVDGAAVLRPG